MLFTALVGGKPYLKIGDFRFQMLESGHLVHLLESCRSTFMVPRGAVKILTRIFVKERQRLPIEKILEMQWFSEVAESISKEFFCEKQ